MSKKPLKNQILPHIVYINEQDERKVSERGKKFLFCHFFDFTSKISNAESWTASITIPWVDLMGIFHLGRPPDLLGPPDGRAVSTSSFNLDTKYL